MTVKEHAARILRVLQILGISVVYRQPSDFPPAAYEADWLAKPNLLINTEPTKPTECDHLASFFTIPVSDEQPSSPFIFQKLCNPDGPLSYFQNSSQAL